MERRASDRAAVSIVAEKRSAPPVDEVIFMINHFLTNETLNETMEEYQSFRNNALLKELEDAFRQLVADKKFELAEIIMRKQLAVPGQIPQTYLYTPACFYEEWGDAETDTDTPALAAICYEQAIDYRYRTVMFTSGSGDGAEVGYHIKRVQKKLKQLQQGA